MSRTKGSVNRQHRPTALDVPGAATSACKVNRKVGVPINYGVAWYENGRPLRWIDIQESVRRGYETARWKAAQRGRRWLDGFERVQANIAEAMANKGHHA